MTPSRLEAYIVHDNPAFDCPALVGELKSMCADVVRIMAASVGSWPRSRAVYGLDVILEHDPLAAAPTPKLLEINFGGDFDAARGAAVASDEEEQFQLWGDDLATVLFTDVGVEGNTRLLRV